MNQFWGLSETAWTAIYAIISFGLFAGAVAAAWYASRQWRTARDQRKDAQKAQVEASRPYVLVTIEPSGASQHLFDIRVKNIGRRPALDVSISLDPPLLRANETLGHEIGKAKMFNEPIAMIAPGQEMRAFYDNHSHRVGRNDLPTLHQVSLTYADSSGRVYPETGVLDIEAMRGTMYASVQTLHDLGQTLERIEKIFSGSSLLGRSGSIEVEAAIETRSERDRRIDEEMAEQRERHDRLVARIRPGSVTEGATPQALTQPDTGEEDEEETLPSDGDPKN
jgi:hypothetical protein